MNREIKFRGQMTTGEWVYGLPYQDSPNETLYYKECSFRICWIAENGGRANAPVKNGTIGQFTGLHDKNGKEIYEGDLITFKGDNDAIFEVFWHDDLAQFRCSRVHYKNNRCGGYIPEFVNRKEWEVIGNIHQNPEMR